MSRGLPARSLCTEKWTVCGSSLYHHFSLFSSLLLRASVYIAQDCLRFLLLHVTGEHKDKRKGVNGQGPDLTRASRAFDQAVQAMPHGRCFERRRSEVSSSMVGRDQADKSHV
jgi:hypothetical protein